MVANNPTLRDNPRLYLAGRANRLDRLCTLKAPAIILRGEVALILQALTIVVQQEEPHRQGGNLPGMIERFRKELMQDQDQEMDRVNGQ